jgi:formate dehydrogenase
VPCATTAEVVECVKEGARSTSRKATWACRSTGPAGGYQLLEQCLSGSATSSRSSPSLEASGLRGLGGAGFPTGRKWRIVRSEPAPELMAVNIDEGEPGTFKDRVFLERDPHRFLEGMLIAAWAVGIDAIYIYLRDEYHGCRTAGAGDSRACRRPACQGPAEDRAAPRRRRLHLRRRVRDDRVDRRQARHAAPAPALTWRRWACSGGRRWSTTSRPCSGCATCWSAGRNGFTSQGANGRKGLRSFSVSGRVRKPGVKVAPAGVTIQELIDEYCGGMADGHKFYAYLPGGASGGILPAKMNDIPLDFDTLQPYGCFIGSAAVVVLSDKDTATARRATRCASSATSPAANARPAARAPPRRMR